jgi:hypothetical protein
MHKSKDVIFSGVQTFQQNMFFRIQMLNYLLSADLKISYEQLLRLWNACTVKTKGVIQKKELIRVLYNGSLENNSVSVQSKFFSEKDSQFRFFTDVLCNP